MLTSTFGRRRGSIWPLLLLWNSVDLPAPVVLLGSISTIFVREALATVTFWLTHDLTAILHNFKPNNTLANSGAMEINARIRKAHDKEHISDPVAFRGLHLDALSRT